MVNNKKKGNAFEREVYKILRDSGLFREVKRTIGSGSSDEPVDIKADGYAIECKCGGYNDLKLLRVYEDTKLTAKGLFPIVIFKQPNKKIKILTEATITNCVRIPMVGMLEDWINGIRTKNSLQYIEKSVSDLSQQTNEKDNLKQERGDV